MITMITIFTGNCFYDYYFLCLFSALLSVLLSGILLSFMFYSQAVGNNDRTGCIPGNIQSCTPHIKDPVYASTPATRATPSMGSPTEASTMASITMPAPGTPAVPIEASVAVTTMEAIWVRER